MKNKWKLRGEKILIEDELTWEERRSRWRVIQIAGKEEEEGRKVKLGHGRVWMKGKCWDEEREDLRDERGRYWKKEQCGGEREKEEGGRKEQTGVLQKHGEH